MSSASVPPPQPASGPAPRILNSTVWSLAGVGVPILVAVVCLPVLIGGLGTQRFGVLALIWLIQAICTQLATGLGRATARTVAEYIAADRQTELPVLIWSAVTGHTVCGLAAGAILAAATPVLTGRLLAIPVELQYEAELAFYLLAAGIPMFLLLDALRSVLQALSRFDLLAAVQIPCQAFNYLAPLGVLWFSSSLLPITAAMLASRLLMVLACFLMMFQQLPSVRRPALPRWRLIRKLLPDGGWMTLVCLSGGIISTLDRFVIGSVISLSAVAWYSTAFDLTTKLWILPASLLSVLFPVFSGMQINRKSELPFLFWRAVTLLNAAVVPVVGLLLLSGEHLLRFWVGEVFAAEGIPVIRWVATGSAVSIVAQVPLILLQTSGHARTPAVMQLLILPLYGLAIWWLAPEWGIAGVAAIWCARGLLESLILACYSARVLRSMTEAPGQKATLLRQLAVLITLPLFWITGERLSEHPAQLALAGLTLLLLLLIAEWNFLLAESDRLLLLQRLRGAASRLRGLSS